MKGIILLLLFPFVSKGQDLTKVKKISFKYKIGHYNFGDTGHYEKEELVEFTPTSKNKFVRTSYYITKRYVVNPQTKENNLSINDTVFEKGTRDFSLSAIQGLLNQLNTTKDNFGIENIQPFISPISQKEILSIAKQNNETYWFIDDETGKVDGGGRELINKIKMLSQLDSFLFYRKPDLKIESHVIDAWNDLSISFIEQNDTTQYLFELHTLLGQPFSKTKNNDYSHRVRFINSEANNYLTQMLPKNSSIKKAIGFERLKNNYIMWYISNQMWKKSSNVSK